ncbi:uncharacterized protein LOC116308514 [Actinia tenebrosa]|uniref:Uncharacterized protein LOC116308514 n=1 Tax=Actinia tenebrosa TaxID=6105 RepID=A0A6P8JAQ6_ACTTE|nr:uncharacterized protein LOC116308514 [Actinia tenebrosa]XP_031574814.1 uncharacterized protein LOC116308514 [Actinia tenebrosa]
MVAPTNISDALWHSYAYTGCFGTFNTMSCVRDSTLTCLAFFTCLICIFKVVKLHRHHHSLPNQYIIYYSGIVNCILCGLNWLYLAKTPVLLVTQFLKTSCQILTVTHFHCLLAARMTRREETFKLFNIPIMFVLLMYMLVTVIVGLATMKSEFNECKEPEWLLLSSAEFFIVQFFLVAGICISRELNVVRMQENNRASQKRDLWGIIFVFEISAMASLIHDIVMRITGPSNSCQGVFLNTAAGYTAVYITVKIIRWFLPLWAIAIIFGIEANHEMVERQPIYITPGNSGNFTSAFRPRGTSFNYKHLYDDPPPAERPLISPYGSSSGGMDAYGSFGKSPKDLRSGQTYPQI